LVVCDNGSTDGSVELVRDRFPSVKVVALESNHGFAAGNNLAVPQCSGTWIGFLNNDMRVSPGWLREMLRPVQDQPGLSCITSKILNWNGSAIDYIGAGINFQGFGFQMDYGLKTSPLDRPRRLMCPCGGAMLIKKSVFEEMGGFDADYFAFYEDTDLGWRLNLLGHDVWYTPDAVVFHRHHSTSNHIRPARLRVLYERNSLFTMYKCLDDDNLAAALPVALVLLNDKALRMADLDPNRFLLRPGGSALESYRPARNQVLHSFDPGATSSESLVARARRVLRTQGVRTAFHKGVRLLRSRTRARATRLLRQVASGGTQIPDEAIACWVALDDFARSLDRLQEKRRLVQTRRVRTDEQLLPLFHFALEPSYHEEHYVRFHRWICEVTGLDRRFAAGHLHRG
jgi:GT2 family glycosyltransferase